MPYNKKGGDETEFTNVSINILVGLKSIWLLVAMRANWNDGWWPIDSIHTRHPCRLVVLKTITAHTDRRLIIVIGNSVRKCSTKAWGYRSYFGMCYLSPPVTRTCEPLGTAGPVRTTGRHTGNVTNVPTGVSRYRGQRKSIGNLQDSTHYQTSVLSLKSYKETFTAFMVT